MVFIKFNNVFINEYKIHFRNLEIYKYYEEIEKKDLGHATWYVFNDFGGILKYDGMEFEYSENRYVINDQDLSEDGKQYFVDIYDEGLLFEEYKNIFPPMKWYNMVNPQETYFDIIVDIYKNN